MHYSSKDEQKLTEQLSNTSWQYSQILSIFQTLSTLHPSTAEYSFYGFLRRVKILRRCIKKVFDIFPLDLTTKITEEDKIDLEIYLHTALINIYGSLDNLAWTWVIAKNVTDSKGNKLKGSQIGLGHKNMHVRNSLPECLLNELRRIDSWNKDFLSPLRHACAHRCPPYIPPSCLSTTEAAEYQEIAAEISAHFRLRNFDAIDALYSKQDNLGKPAPLLVTSFTSPSEPIHFHQTILGDWNTIYRLSILFAKELLPENDTEIATAMFALASEELYYANHF